MKLMRAALRGLAGTLGASVGGGRYLHGPALLSGHGLQGQRLAAAGTDGRLAKQRGGFFISSMIALNKSGCTNPGPTLAGTCARRNCRPPGLRWPPGPCSVARPKPPRCGTSSQPCGRKCRSFGTKNRWRIRWPDFSRSSSCDVQRRAARRGGSGRLCRHPPARTVARAGISNRPPDRADSLSGPEHLQARAAESKRRCTGTCVVAPAATTPGPHAGQSGDCGRQNSAAWPPRTGQRGQWRGSLAAPLGRAGKEQRKPQRAPGWAGWNSAARRC